MINKEIKQYILLQEPDRQPVLTTIHSIIIEEDKAVVPAIESMMRSEMILYKVNGSMKYGLASTKKYMSLHLLPMYLSTTIFSRYQLLLQKAKFQKGCINFVTAEEMPLDIIRSLIAECSTIDLQKIREEQLKQKKTSRKVK